MASRALWKGSLTFGGVTIPVKLFTAIRERRFPLHLLHDKDHVRLQQQMICSLDRKPVPSDEQVKGYEAAPGQYVIVSKDEIDALEFPGGRDIEILSFVAPEEVDPRFFERTYYLGPDGDSDQYALLSRALQDSGKIGICQWLMRKRYYVGALKVMNDTLSVVTMRYADEVILADALDIPEAAVTERESRTAKSLIQALAGEFDPASLQNDHIAALQKLIEQKAKGKKVVVKKQKLPAATAEDNLLPALEASLKRIQGRKVAA